MCAFLDTRVRIANDLLEALGREFVEYAAYAFIGERFLVASLRRGQEIQRIDALVLDQRLFEYAVALDDIHEIIYDTPLAPHDQIEVAQSDVEIDHRNTFAAARESARYAGGGSGLSNSSLTRSYNDSLGQFWILLCKDLGAADLKVAACVFQQPDDCN